MIRPRRFATKACWHLRQVKVTQKFIYGMSTEAGVCVRCGPRYALSIREGRPVGKAASSLVLEAVCTFTINCKGFPGSHVSVIVVA